MDKLDDRARRAQIAAVGAERLRERAHLQRDACLLRARRAVAVGEHAQPMGVVRHQPGVVLLRKLAQGLERRDVAVHGENAVGRDQHVPVAQALLEKQLLHVPHVAVAEADHLGPR